MLLDFVVVMKTIFGTFCIIFLFVSSLLQCDKKNNLKTMNLKFDYNYHNTHHLNQAPHHTPSCYLMSRVATNRNQNRLNKQHYKHTHHCETEPITAHSSSTACCSTHIIQTYIQIYIELKKYTNLKCKSKNMNGHKYTVRDLFYDASPDMNYTFLTDCYLMDGYVDNKQYKH